MLYGEQPWNSISSLNDRVVVLPIAALEQHGHHLPMLTDTMICTEIARRAELELGNDALFLPVLWVGSSHHHLGHPGTISLSQETYTRLIEELLESVIHAGFRRIALLNAHGGNETPGQTALLNVQLRHRESKPDLFIAFASWMDVASQQIANIESLAHKHVTHACELETSVILRLRPELVKLEAAKGANIPFASKFYTPDFSAPSRVYVPRSFDQLSRSGAFGHPELGTLEKGEALLEVAVRAFVAFVREFATWPALEVQ
jgi:creatinine amidohydrolase